MRMADSSSERAIAAMKGGDQCIRALKLALMSTSSGCGEGTSGKRDALDALSEKSGWPHAFAGRKKYG